VEARNHYWVLDCILALTAVVLGGAALSSFAGVAVPPGSWVTTGAVALVCGAGAGVALLFAGFVWRESRRRPQRGAARLHQERHAMMIRREHGMAGLSIVGTPAAKPAEASETPETLLATSLIDVKAKQHSQQRRRRAPRRAVAVAA
jgi:hypothetical protein